jgi:hypothetical protein
MADDFQMQLKRFILGDRQTIAGTVYGTIIVLSVLAAGAKAYEHRLWHLGAIAAMSTIVLWVAHVYSHGLGESVNAGRRLTAAELAAIARSEYSIVLAAILPIGALALGAAGVVQARSAVQLAFGLGVVTLATQGVRYAKLERLNRAGTIVTVTLNLVIGLALIALEVLVAH